MSLVPPPGLQVDIFVTHHKSLYEAYVAPTPRPAPPLHSNADETETLVPPSADFTRPQSRASSVDGRSSPNRLSYVDLSYFTREYGDEERSIGDTNTVHQNYILDLTNFDGDNDAPLPGEEDLNRRVMKTGKHRRAKSRKANASAAKQSSSDLQVPLPDESQESRGRPKYQAHRLSQQPAEHRSETPKADRRRSSLSYLSNTSVDLDDKSRGGSHEGSDGHSNRLSSYHSLTPSWSTSLSVPESRPKSFSEYDDLIPSRPGSLFIREWDASSDATSYRALIGKGAHGDDLRLQVDKQEMRDVSMVSEHARPGKPKIDHILAYEVEKSQGSTIVGCELFLHHFSGIYSYLLYRLWARVSECHG
jgi:hypothetical protein